MKASRPVIHGTDHLPGGADPIPLTTSGYIHYEGDGTAWNTGVPSFDDNLGDYIVIQAEGPHVGDLWGAAIEIVATEASNGGVAILDHSGQGITLFGIGDSQIDLELSGTTGRGIFLINPSTRADARIDILSSVNGVRVFSGEGSNFVFDPTTNSVLVRVGDGVTPTPGIIALDAFGISGDAASLASFYVGDLVLGSPPVDHKGISAVLVENSATVSFFVARGTGVNLLQVDWGGQVWMPHLPTSSPGGSGKLWNNSGVVNIT